MDRMSVTRRPLIAANWKMNGLRADGLDLAREVSHRARQAERPSAGGEIAEILVCPPATLLFLMAECLGGSPVLLGAQDCHPRPNGAHTGDLSAPMLKDAGCSHVILGHSERRADHHEGDALVRAKAEAAIAAGLVALVCVGETEAERDAGRALDIVGTQLRGSVPPQATPATLILAYEPVWAIGTGRTPTVADIEDMHRHIRSTLAGLIAHGEAVRILYGGSVKPSNAVELLAVPHVDGALVGGASLKATDFWTIVEAVPQG
jgi:triosephosphate isomerase